MQNAILEERILKEEETEGEIEYIEDGFYFGNRFSAAMQFARDIVSENQKIINSGIGYYLCHLTSINSFIYALLELKYSKQDKAYTFPKFSKPSLPEKSENKFSIVG